MDWLIDLILGNDIAHAIFVYSLVIALGVILGKIKLLGISLGSNDVIANAIGRRDESAIEKTVHTSIAIAVLGGVLVALLGELCASWLLRSFHVPEEIGRAHV